MTLKPSFTRSETNDSENVEQKNFQCCTYRYIYQVFPQLVCNFPLNMQTPLSQNKPKLPLFNVYFTIPKEIENVLLL